MQEHQNIILHVNRAFMEHMHEKRLMKNSNQFFSLFNMSIYSLGDIFSTLAK